MKPSRKYFIAAAIVLIIVVVAFRAVRNSASRSDSDPAGTAAVSVEVTPVAVGTISEEITDVETIAAMHNAMVSSETAGRVTGVLVKVGDNVREGQTPIQVDDELKAVAVEQAKAQLIAAETNFRKAEKEYSGKQLLYQT